MKSRELGSGRNRDKEKPQDIRALACLLYVRCPGYYTLFHMRNKAGLGDEKISMEGEEDERGMAGEW